MMSMVEKTLLEKVQGLAKTVNEKSMIGALSKTLTPLGQQKNEYWLPNELMLLAVKEGDLAESEKSGIVLLKYFQPNGDKTWYVSELLDDGQTFYGLYEDNRGQEFGYFSVKELRETSCGMGLWIERDYHFIPQTFEELKK